MNNKLKYLILSVFLSFLTGCVTNPISGESQFIIFSEEQDVELGKNYAPEIEKQLGGQIQNLVVQNYLNSIGQQIARVSHQPPYFSYQYIALDDEMINAFALPGGYIFITKGMLLKLENEAQLAAILAHETIHVVARHSSASISREIGMEVALSVALSKSSGAATQVAGISRQIIGLSYSRSQEREADLGGLDYMVKAGFDPWQMVKTMQMLEAEQKTKQIEFFSTHPSPENRVGYISQAIQSRGYPTGLRVGAEDYQRFILNELKN
ncbi:MAG: M48 family metallopeptidase [Phycisphaerae bacterium]